MRYPQKSTSSFSSMRNALRLLSLFSIEKPELSASEMADNLEIAVSTAHRLANTLLHEGFLVKDSQTKLYRLGSSILAMSSIVHSQIKLCRNAKPILEKLVKDTKETAHIAILKGVNVVYLDKVDNQHPVHLLSHAGRQNPAYCTSSGQVILAYQPEEAVNSVIEAGFIPYTTQTITEPHLLKSKLQQIRNEGAAVSKEELHAGVISIAAPVTNRTSDVIASISIAGPTARIHSQNEAVFIKLVKKAANELSMLQ